MYNWPRLIVFGILFVVLIVLLAAFFTFVLKLALTAALIAFAYYWFTRATETRRRNRNW